MTDPQSGDETTDVYVRPFADVLRELGAGRTHDEMSEALHQLVSRVKDTGKGGSVTLIVKVAPLKKSEDVLVVTDDIKKNLPVHDRKPSLSYVDKTGNLTRSDPNQLTFDSLREVPADPAAKLRAQAKEATA